MKIEKPELKGTAIKSIQVAIKLSTLTAKIPSIQKHDVHKDIKHPLG